MPLPTSRSNPEPKRPPRESSLPLPSAENDGPSLPMPPPPPTASKRESAPTSGSSAKPKDSLPPGWAIDPKTGKKYKELHSNSPEAIKAFRATKGKGLTVEQLFQYTEDDPDFDLDDLNGSADTFLAHLRVPPSREELEQLRKEREARMRKMQAARVREELDSEED